jgi:hypothetical protein
MLQVQQQHHQAPAPALVSVPALPCGECIDDPWVVIAALKLPADAVSGAG